MTVEEILEAEFDRLDKGNADGSVQDGAMGVALFAAFYGKRMSNSEYVDSAFSLISGKCAKLNDGEFLDFHKGHCGIALSLLLLKIKGYIDKPLDEILDEVDNNIFRQITKRLHSMEAKHIDSVLDIATYVALRLKNKTFSELNERVFARFLSDIINELYPKFNSSIFSEPASGSFGYKMPRFLLLLSLSTGNGFDSRLNHIIMEIEKDIISRIPYAQANRLSLANSIDSLSKRLTLNSHWSDFNRFLIESIDFAKVNEEYTLNNVSLHKGLGWFALNLIMNVKYSKTKRRDLLQPIYDKMAASQYNRCTFSEIERRGFTGLYGICGLKLIEILLTDLYEK